MVLGTRNDLDRIVEIWNLGKVELIDQLYAPEFVNRTAPEGIAPTLDGLKKFVTALRVGFPDLHYTLDDSIYAGDKLVQRVTGRGTMTGEFNGMPPTNKTATWTEIHIVRLVDGRIVEHWGVADQLSMFVQLGVIPAPGRELVAA
jgi:predicted ester cyclase